MTNPQRNPRVLVLGDSWVRGLTKGRNTVSRLVPEALAPSATLDLSRISRVVTDLVDGHLDEIDEFEPDFALLAVGGAESLVFPAAWIQRLVDRFAPPDWQGIEGLQPRAMYARDRGKRARQRVTVAAKALLKQLLINLFGGRRRVPLAEYEAATRLLLELLARRGTTVVLVEITDPGRWLSPKTRRCVRRTNAVSRRLADEHPRALWVGTADVLQRWDDYLPDHVHLSLSGHRKIADRVLAAMAGAGGPWAEVLPRAEPEVVPVAVALAG